MSRAAMQQALEALVTCCAEEWRTLNNFGMKQVYDEKKVNAAIAALHAALAEPEQEPDGISWLKRDSGYFTALTPRKPLTDEMVKRMKEVCTSMEMRGAFADGWLSAEAAHGIGDSNAT